MIVKGRLTLKVVFAESVTMNLGLKMPDVVGVPPNAPVVESILMPDGKPVADQV